MTSKAPDQPIKRPRGRPPYSGRIGRLRADLLKWVPGHLERLQAMADAGDVAVSKMLLGIVIPPLRSVTQPEPIPINPDDSLLDIGRTALRLMAEGTLALDDGLAFLTGLASLATLEDKTDIREQLLALKESIEARKDR